MFGKILTNDSHDKIYDFYRTEFHDHLITNI